MSYFRPAMGDGPVTSPCQVDPSACSPPFVPPPPATTTTPPDSGGIMGWLHGLITPVLGTQPTATPDQGMDGTTKIVLLGGGALTLYLLTRKKRA